MDRLETTLGLEGEYREDQCGFPWIANRAYRGDGFVRDLRQARPGDILLHDRHVVLLLGVRSATRGDILHVSRSIKARGVGGIEVVRDADLTRFRGRILRIFRHEALMPDDERRPSPPPPGPALVDGMRVALLTDVP